MIRNKITIFYDQPQHTQTVALDGVEYRIRLTYRDRTRSWYLDLYDTEGTAIALGRRLAPKSSPISGFIAEGGPPGMFVAFGVDPYERTGVKLYYIPEAELPTRSTSSDLKIVLH